MIESIVKKIYSPQFPFLVIFLQENPPDLAAFEDQTLCEVCGAGDRVKLSFINGKLQKLKFSLK